jgi:hypothetical protein
MTSATQFHLTGGFHLTDVQLLLHCDGGLREANSSLAASHLEGCSSCRSRLQELTEGVDAFLLFRGRVFLSALPSPLHAWPDLDEQFERIDHPWKAKLDSALDGLRSMCRGLRYNMVAAAALLILIFVIYQPWQATVSAAKLLARAIAAQSAVLRSTKEPVVHHKLRIQFHSAAPASHTLVGYESWRDFRNGRFREALASGSSVTSDERIAELQRVYATNHLDWQSPLSAQGYERWNSALVGGRTSVARDRSGTSPDGSRLILTTLATPNPEGDAIGKAQLVVRASDWHPVALLLTLKDREYEISEVAFQVLPISQFDSSLFDEIADGADQVNPNSPTPGNSLPTIHAARIDKPHHQGLGAPHAAQPRATPSADGKQDAAETNDAGLDLPVTLSYPAPTPLVDQPVTAGPRLNLSLAPAPIALNPGMALAEQLARQQSLMSSTQQPAPKQATPATPRRKAKEKHAMQPGK